MWALLSANFNSKKIISMKNNVFLFIGLGLILYSCSKKEINWGAWSDNIMLSKKSAEFNAIGDSITITTKGIGGMISNVTVISVDTLFFYNFNGINFLSGNYVIKQNCFDVEHRDSHTLFIKVDANPYNVKRIIDVGLQSGDFGAEVTVTQKTK